MGPNKNPSKELFRQVQELYEKLESQEKKHEAEMQALEDYCNTKVEKLETIIKELKEENAQRQRTIEDQKTIIKEQQETIQTLKNDNERLKRILNNNSSNSSNPPSSDGPGKSVRAANTYNSRKKTGKKQGAQKGHKAHSLSKKELEEKIEKNEILCKEVEIGNPSKEYIVRYTLDFEIRPTATRYKIYIGENGKYDVPTHLTADISYGTTIKSIVSCLYSEGVVSNDRIADLINSMSGNAFHIATGTVYGICRQFSSRCKERIEKIKTSLMNGRVICTDATVISNNGKQYNIRNFSNHNQVLYEPSPEKSLKVLKGMSILTDFTGTFVHDHETALYNFGGNHGECNVHLERYLKKNTEESGHSWSNDLSLLLNRINKEKKNCIRDGHNCFTDGQLEQFETEFDEIMLLAKEQHIKGDSGNIAYKEETSLINRINKYRKNHLLFMYDFDVPFENNMSERDLRKCKNRQKMAGGFRNEDGISMFCNIMSIVETCKRNKQNILNTIADMFAPRSVLS